jgi:protein-disulfide isomerase
MKNLTFKILNAIDSIPHRRQTLNKKGGILVVIILALLLQSAIGASIVHAQSRDEINTLKKEIEDLKKGQSEILEELGRIKDLLEEGQKNSSSTPRNITLGIDGHPVKGTKDAKLIVMEFSDYQCPFCGRFFSQVYSKINDEYVKPGKVMYVFRDFPVQSKHPQAFKAAEAAHCAGDQGKYWEMHDLLFSNQKALMVDDLVKYADKLRLDRSAFKKCLDDGKHATQVRESFEEGIKASVRGTPTFFLGVTDSNAVDMKPIAVIRGAQPHDQFKKILDSLLTSLQSQENK